MDVDPTLILTRADLARLMRPRDYLHAVEAGFRALAEGRATAPPPMHVGFQAGGFHVKGASLEEDGEAFAAFKVNGNFPGNPGRGLPTIQGAVLFCDGKTGALLAVMDSIEITLRRTAAATALAARHLARPDSHTVAVVGCGDQALPQLQALADVLPLQSGRVFDLDPARAERLASTSRLKLSVARDLAEATVGADVVVTCTTAREPFLGPGHVRPGAFVAAVGADAPHKSEIAPALMAAARVFTDVTAQAAEMGDLHHAVAAGAMARSGVAGELADLVCGRVAGRDTDDQVALFDSTGVAVQDVAAALTAFRCAAQGGAALRLALGAPAAPCL
jgi:ornithine cyclodeaminase/alanine dehydrogenase-like protein (mu-crystallin family)